MSNNHTDENDNTITTNNKEESACEVLVERGVALETPPPLPSKHNSNVDIEAPDGDVDEDRSDQEMASESSTITEKKGKSKMVAFEIDNDQEEEEQQHQPLKLTKSEESEDINLSDDDILDEDDDMEGLLDQPQRSKTKALKKTRKEKANGAKLYSVPGICCSGQRIGNTTVFWPSMYHKTGWGMMGPHFFGPPCVLAILWSASLYFIKHAWHKVGWITATICVGFTVVATYHFFDCAFRDPGIVRCSELTNRNERPPPPDRHHRWCDLCQAYQPPSGAHCPDCNVCVVDFDHHCAWMGCCIGGRNYKPFMRFNMTWLLYLTYAVLWVSFLGPVLFRHPHGDDSPEVADNAVPTENNNNNTMVHDDDFS